MEIKGVILGVWKRLAEEFESAIGEVWCEPEGFDTMWKLKDTRGNYFSILKIWDTTRIYMLQCIYKEYTYVKECISTGKAVTN